MAGWIFKSSKKNRPKQVARGRPSANIGARGTTIRARILSEEKLGGMGSSVLYRDHIKSGGYVTPGGRFIQPKKTPPPKPYILERYKHLKREEKPPIINLIEDQMQSTEFKTRMELEDRASLNDRMNGYVHWYHYIPVNEKFRKLICCFAGKESFFIEQDNILGRVRVSSIYESDTAREIVQRKRWTRIIWRKSADLQLDD